MAPQLRSHRAVKYKLEIRDACDAISLQLIALM